jgi:hypothetical protein
LLMATYLIFERETGRVVHIHNQPVGAKESSPDEVFQMLGMDRSRGLDIVVAPTDAPKYASFRVVDGEVVISDDDELAFGGAGLSDGLEVPDVQRRFGPLNMPD